MQYLEMGVLHFSFKVGGALWCGEVCAGKRYLAIFFSYWKSLVTTKVVFAFPNQV